ncbi:TPA: hypothetical protein JTD06_004334 [Escherichia coli]|uniref:hypothetical protein n=1 Tax=Escherichia coli TaxID=562 RepID=UPI000C1BC2F9|nr:hypothetical protein [Escherichia coli]EJZ6015012.1 hypothetical protein [Escherichia coli]HAX8863639.1 hypothetical protein [Escherichia coli]
MKSIYLKYFLSFVFVGVMAMIVCIPVYIVYLAQQPATPEQLTEILQETPCAAEAFQETLNYQSEPLTLGKANKIASECRKRNEMAEARLVRENELNKIREKQLQALSDADSAKER